MSLGIDEYRPKDWGEEADSAEDRQEKKKGKWADMKDWKNMKGD